ncbi:DinB family protein [Lysinibacillus sp. SGAir0095]|uniref:DinB family protein n=1 Tax=Lysinibacillus sp. SGAir0095 TaxID=2070463 RepID=UPI0010CD3A43|nr:DinB family protein [Lysinibacillus sp. SGAir0095]QCR30878.1 DinB family protein [Lysinibacillus sp. SGAir0095]
MERLQKVREEILECVSNLTDSQLNEVVEEGTWSIVQVLEHLYIMEENVTSQMQRALKQEEFDVPGTFPLQVIADRTKKISAPEFLLPSNNFYTFDELKEKLAASRASLEKFVHETSDVELNQKTFAHRRFGVLTLNQWISLIGYHEQRHIGQIEEIKAALTK